MIAIVDYGMGNLRSVEKAFAKVGHPATITNDPSVLEDAEKIVLPGVGAFADAIAELRRRQLVQPLQNAVAREKPFLGICLGLQLLFDVSYEDGEHQGLGIVPGKVVRFDIPAEYKVPHMGWNQLQFPPDRPRAPIFTGLAEGAHVYFVHSYYVVPEDEQVIAAVTEYAIPFTSAICRGNLFATQFHPEKSQADGLRILENFATLR